MTTREPIFEQVRPDTGEVRTFYSSADLDYTPGDVVNTPRGTGVVSATLVDDFGFPQLGDTEMPVQASEQTPAYIVGFGGRSAPYRGTALSDGNLQRPRQNSAQASALADPIAEHGLKPEAMRINWGKRGLLQWWSDAGGLWRRARQYLKRERDVSDDEARSLVSKRKDMVLGTNRWRTRF